MMRKLVRLTALIGALVLASGAPAYARGGGGHGGGGGFGGGHAGGFGGGGHAFGGGHSFGGGHAFGGPHGGFGGHHGFGHRFDGHHGFERFHGGGVIGFGSYWDPYWDPWAYWPYGPYAYMPSAPSVQGPPVYIEKPQAGYCPSAGAYYPGVQSCPQPWTPVAPHAG